ncbi:GCN5-related N-acetyltransferase [Naegleria gruberi]|uniref:GCN5-related N-acetyltransferase n=1 Tax=Naegleria gruberi TaxID=5762 RepID=D2VJA2_NAEGR|nr:GCN5-related N-acetyltransferase [Naegleria gruberi]EFC43160.1 GCN5-related N-acetyltransferase [Naegleria gruberi]|eukprot:XP_002675904.1 GCN5-related N-acetyltransferase [Naegleria gruberi strain NEG-M]
MSQLSIRTTSYHLPNLNDDEQSFKLQLFSSAEQFWDYTSSYLMEFPAENNLVLGIIKSCIETPNRFSSDKRFLMSIEDLEGNIQMVIVWTIPFLILTSYSKEMEKRRVILKSLIGFFLRNDYETLRIEGEFKAVEEMISTYGRKCNGILSDDEESEWFIQEYCKERELLYPNQKLNVIRNIGMTTYRLSLQDLTPLKRDYQDLEFHILDLHETNRVEEYLDRLQEFYKTVFPEKEQNSREYIMEFILSRTASRQNAYYCIRKENPSKMIAISMANPLPQSARVSCVMSIPDERGKGIGSYIVHQMAKDLLVEKPKLTGEPCQCLFLFADLSNPSAIHLYEGAGFKGVRNVCELEIKYQDEE